MSIIDEYEKQFYEREDKKKKIYLQLFKSENGEYVLKDLKKLSAIDSPTGPLDIQTSNYINGAQSIVKYILNLVKEEKR